MKQSFCPRCIVVVAAALGLALSPALRAQSSAAPVPPAAAPAKPGLTTVEGMPPVIDPSNLYSETGAGRVAPAAASALPRIYVPNLRSNDVYVIDPATFKVVDRFKVGTNPQHAVPSYDLQTIWIANNAEGRTTGSLTPVDPKTGKPGAQIAVDDP